MPERLVFAYGDKTAQHTASQHSDVFVLKASTRWGFFCDMTATVLQVMASVLARGSGVDAAALSSSWMARKIGSSRVAACLLDESSQCSRGAFQCLGDKAVRSIKSLTACFQDGV